MASLLTNHVEIEVVRTKHGDCEITNSPQEKAGQTFVKGTPVQLNAGVLQAWDGTTVAAGIYGVAAEDAHNLATDGAGFPSPYPFGSVTFPGASSTFGKVPNQASGVNIADGAPPVKGLVVVFESNLDTIFRAQVDNGSGAATTPTKANIGTQYGMTVDASGHWYIDFNKTTVGTNTVCVLIDLDPVDGSVANARVLFQFTKASMQIVI